MKCKNKLFKNNCCKKNNKINNNLKTQVPCLLEIQIIMIMNK